MNDLVAVGQLDRSTYLGSSDAAAVLGLSPWKTPLALYLEKIGMAPDDSEDDLAKQRLFRRGKKLEPYVLEMLSEEFGYQITARNRRYRDGFHPFLAAEIDAETEINGETVNIEIKTVHPFAAAGKYGEIDTDEIPIEYAAQAMHGLMVTGRQRTIFGVLVGADNLLRYEVKRDDETIVGMRKKELDFWINNVIPMVPPDPIRLTDVYQLFRKDADTIIEATEEIAQLIGEYVAVKRTEKMCEEKIEELKFQIGMFALGAEVGIPTQKPKHVIVANGQKAMTIAYQQQTRIDSDALRERHPEIARECSKVSKFYKFDLPRGKSK